MALINDTTVEYEDAEDPDAVTLLSILLVGKFNNDVNKKYLDVKFKYKIHWNSDPLTRNTRNLSDCKLTNKIF